LGSGRTPHKDFINIDFFFEPKIDYGCDLRYPLRIASNVANGIFCEHTMEHINYEDNTQLFKECHRILKPGGTIRIILPDISLFTKNYEEGNQEWFEKYEDYSLNNSSDPKRDKMSFDTPMKAISFVTQEYFHVSCWDEQTLRLYLTQAGFKDISVQSWRKGKDDMLLIDSPKESRKHVSIYIEATK